MIYEKNLKRTIFRTHLLLAVKIDNIPYNSKS
jgi:hypothetical protein